MEFKKDAETIIKEASDSVPGFENQSLEKRKEIIKQTIDRKLSSIETSDKPLSDTEEGEGQPLPQDPSHTDALYSDLDSVPAFGALSTDEKQTVAEYVERVKRDGIIKITLKARKALKDPAMLDALHDVVADIVLKKTSNTV